MDYQELKFWLDLVQMVATFALFIYVVITRKSDNNSKLILELEKEHKTHYEDQSNRHANLKERVVRLESRPLHESDIIEIHKRMNGISEGQGKLEGRFDETSEAVKRLHDYMIRRGSNHD